MSAETISRKITRALRNQTGLTLTASQVCELIDFGVLDTLTGIVNEETKAEARGRLEQPKPQSARASARRIAPLTREAIEVMLSKA